MSESILLTGGAGYIGSTLVPELLRQRYKVTVVDSFLHKEESLVAVAQNTALTLIRGDVRDAALMTPLVAAADIIIPLAGIVGAPACDRDPANATSTNLDAISWMMKLVSAKQLVCFPSTHSVYGNAGNEVAVDENSPLNPLSLYARDKRDAEASVLAHPNSIVLRLATNFGIAPRMRLDLLLNYFTYEAVTRRFVTLFEAHYKRSLIHVRDASAAFIFALEKRNKMKGHVYNVGHPDANLSKWQICSAVQTHIPDFLVSETKRGTDPDQRNCTVSYKKLTALAFKPNHSILAGIGELVQGYRARGVVRQTRTRSG